MRIIKQMVILDAADIAAESEFWAGLLGGTVDADDTGDWNSIVVDGQINMAIQLAPDHEPPDWPGGSPQQIHLDIYVEPDQVPAAHDEVIALGARLLQASDDVGSDSGFQVYADPAGHPFCICWD